MLQKARAAARLWIGNQSGTIELDRIKSEEWSGFSVWVTRGNEKQFYCCISDGRYPSCTCAPQEEAIEQKEPPPIEVDRGMAT